MKPKEITQGKDIACLASSVAEDGWLLITNKDGQLGIGARYGAIEISTAYASPNDTTPNFHRCKIPRLATAASIPLINNTDPPSRWPPASAGTDEMNNGMAIQAVIMPTYTPQR